MGSNRAPRVAPAVQLPAREAAAALTRQRIMDAAARLFVDSGYVATSVRSIARAAGVAEKTVYLQFETKPAILKAVVDSAIVGSDHDVPAARSQWFLEVLAQSRAGPQGRTARRGHLGPARTHRRRCSRWPGRPPPSTRSGRRCGAGANGATWPT